MKLTDRVQRWPELSSWQYFFINTPTQPMLAFKQLKCHVNQKYSPAFAETAYGCLPFFFISKWTKLTMSGLIGARNTAGRLTLLPVDSPFSEYTLMSGRAAAVACTRRFICISKPAPHHTLPHALSILKLPNFVSDTVVHLLICYIKSHAIWWSSTFQPCLSPIIKYHRKLMKKGSCVIITDKVSHSVIHSTCITSYILFH